MRKVSRRSVLAGLAAPALILPSRKLWMPDKRIYPARLNIFDVVATDAYAAIHDTLGAPAGPPPFPHLLDLSPSTQTYGSTYAVRPPWKVAGVDYNVGIDRSVYPTNASLKNPNTLPQQSSYNAYQPGITWYPATAGSPNLILINGNNLVFDGYDLSLGTGWAVNVMSGDGNVVSNCNVVWPASGASPTYPRGNSLNNYYATLLATPGLDLVNGAVPSTATNTTFTKCFLDSTNCGYNICSLVLSGGAGNTVVTYCQIQNQNGLLIGAGNGSASGWNLIMKYNVIRNAGYYSGTSGDHGDWIQMRGNATVGPINNADFEFNLWLQDANYTKPGYINPSGYNFGGGAQTQGGSLLSAGANWGSMTGTCTWSYNVSICPGQMRANSIPGGTTYFGPNGQNATVSGYCNYHCLMDLAAGRITGPSFCQYNYCDVTGTKQNGGGNPNSPYRGDALLCGYGYNGGETPGPSELTFGNNVYLTSGGTIANVARQHRQH